MLLQHSSSRICRKKHKSITQAQRVFKTAPLYAVTNPEEAAPQSVLDAFAAFFESLWSPSTNPDGSTVQKAGMSYVYDEDGTLIAQTIVGGATTSWGQSARYVYLPTASGPMPVAAIYGTKHYAIQSDHLNTPRRLIQSDGQVAWQWAYSAFGEEKPTTAKTRFANADLNQSFGTTAVPAVTFNLRYPGQYFDQESSLHYNYHRSMDTKTGRYTQVDSIGIAEHIQKGLSLRVLQNTAEFTNSASLSGLNDLAFLGDGTTPPLELNTYSYVANDPLRWADPTGESIARGGGFGGSSTVGGLLCGDPKKEKNCAGLRDNIINQTCKAIKNPRARMACFAAAWATYLSCLSQD